MHAVKTVYILSVYVVIVALIALVPALIIFGLLNGMSLNAQTPERAFLIIWGVVTTFLAWMFWSAPR